MSVGYSESKAPSESKDALDSAMSPPERHSREEEQARAANLAGSLAGTSGERLLAGDRSLESDDPNDPMKVLAPMMPSSSSSKKAVAASETLRRSLESSGSPERRRRSDASRRGSSEFGHRRRSSAKKHRADAVLLPGVLPNTNTADALRQKNARHHRSSSVPLSKEDIGKPESRRSRSQGAGLNPPPRKFVPVNEEEEPSMPSLPPRRRDSENSEPQGLETKKMKKSKKSKSREKLEKGHRSKSRSKSRRADDEAKRLAKSFGELPTKTAGLSLAGLSKSIHIGDASLPLMEDSRG